MEKLQIPLPIPVRAKRGSSSERSLVALNDAEHKSLKESLKGVVQVFLQAVEPNFSEPWTKSLPVASSGTGFVIDLNLRLIVTNAHCVEFARTVLLRKNGDHTQYEARILSVSHQVDIAILSVNDEKFWANADAVEFGYHPRMQQTIDIVGYPIGGDTVSISRGVVSRIDWIPYAQSGGEGQICVQVDAAINPGNSGGPALCRNKLVGVAFQGMSNEEAANVGYIIPVTIVKRVLEDFRSSVTHLGLNIPAIACLSDLEPEGAAEDLEKMLSETSLAEPLSPPPVPTHISPIIPFRWPASKKRNTPLVQLQGFGRFCPRYQTAENPYLRSSVSLPEDLTGVIIRGISQVSNLHDLMKPNDVLVAIDGRPVGNEGRILNVTSQTTMDLQHLVTIKLVGEPVVYTVCRDGKLLELNSVAENPPRRIPLINKSPGVSYFMFSGLVFSPLSLDSEVTEEPLANMLIAKEAETLLISKRRSYKRSSQQAVVLTTLLPHSLTLGYGGVGQYTPLWKVNGKVVNNIVQVALAVSKAEGELVIFTFCDDNCIVIPLEQGMAATGEIQDDYGMMATMSKDVEKALRRAGVDLEGVDEEWEEADEDREKEEEEEGEESDEEGGDKEEEEEESDGSNPTRGRGRGRRGLPVGG